MITLSALQVKDIVFIEDGTKLGNVTDIEINVEIGKITNLVIATKTKTLGMFGESREVVVPWDHIIRIGQDVILVKKDGYTLLAQGQDSENISPS